MDQGVLSHDMRTLALTSNVSVELPIPHRIFLCHQPPATKPRIRALHGPPNSAHVHNREDKQQSASRCHEVPAIERFEANLSLGASAVQKVSNQSTESSLKGLPEFALEVVLLDDIMHFLALILLLPVCSLAGVHNTAHNHKIAQVLQALVLAEPFCKAREVLHMVQTRHGKDYGLVSVLREYTLGWISRCHDREMTIAHSPYHPSARHADTGVGCSPDRRQDGEPAE